jgi:hypothetical protein
VSLRIVKCDANSQPVWEYDGEIVAQDASWICVEAHFNVPDRDDGYFVWQEGDRFVEYYFYDRYYNINRIHDRDTHALRGWYCNIARPARWTGEALEWDDLELDVFVYPDGDLILKDEEAFQQLDLGADERIAAIQSLNELMELAMHQLPPFDR